jgi:anthranilate phosphoribosyltransferase
MGFRDALYELCTPIEMERENTIDMCGTGGDGKNTFNISTAASFVVAGAGGRVIKHGNYGVSSVSGSSNVLEYFGYTFTNDESKLKRSLDQSGVSFLHAPLFHPALKRVGGVRKDLGMKTFFNMLGPLVNPARPSHRLNGVFSLELARVYHYLSQRCNEKYVVLHGLDGYDELSLTGETKIYSNEGDQVLKPSQFGLPTLQPIEILGGTTKEKAAEIFRDVIKGEGSEAQENVVIANAALALKALGITEDLQSGVEKARESIRSGKAEESFRKFIAIK